MIRMIVRRKKTVNIRSLSNRGWFLCSNSVYSNGFESLWNLFLTNDFKSDIVLCTDRVSPVDNYVSVQQLCQFCMSYHINITIFPWRPIKNQPWKTTSCSLPHRRIHCPWVRRTMRSTKPPLSYSSWYLRTTDYRYGKLCSVYCMSDRRTTGEFT